MKPARGLLGFRLGNGQEGACQPRGYQLLPRPLTGHFATGSTKAVLLSRLGADVRLDHSVSHGHALMSEDGAEADIVPRRADRMRRLVSLRGATPRDRQQDRASYLLLKSLDRR